MENIALVATPDAPGMLSQLEFTSCFWSLTCLISLPHNILPKILVLHVSETAAHIFDVQGPGVIRHNRTSTPDAQQYYELWIVGQPHITEYAAAVLAVLEDHFGLAMSPDERQSAIESVVRAVSCVWCSEYSIQ